MKVLFQGAPVVVVTGLLLGTAMQPELAVGEAASPRIEVAAVPGPQDMDVAWTSASYDGKVPDYVLGTDWTHPRAPRPLPEVEIPPLPTYDEPPPVLSPPPPPTGVLAPAQSTNPSETGDILAADTYAIPASEQAAAPPEEVEALPPV